jgi:hypothetical protein
MAKKMEAEFKLRMANYTHANMKKIESSLIPNIMFDLTST